MSDNSKDSLTIWKKLVPMFGLWVVSVPVFVAVDQNIPAVLRLIYASLGVVMLMVGVICHMREQSR